MDEIKSYSGTARASGVVKGSISVGGRMSGKTSIPTVVVEPNPDYDNLLNKPKINGIELSDNLSFEELGEETISNAELKEIIDKQFMEVFK